VPLVEICARVYRPRRPRESLLYRLVSQHIEEFPRVYPERFSRTQGSPRPVVMALLPDLGRQREPTASPLRHASSVVPAGVPTLNRP
jgi:hypothetical protein